MLGFMGCDVIRKIQMSKRAGMTPQSGAKHGRHYGKEGRSPLHMRFNYCSRGGRLDLPGFINFH